MTRELTITISEDVYRGLSAAAGNRSISEFIEELARPAVAHASLDAAYHEMALDADREREACEWSEGLIQDWASRGLDDAAR